MNIEKKGNQTVEISVRKRVISGLFLTCLIGTALLGILSSKSDYWVASSVGVIIGLVGMFFGMGIEWIRNKERIEDFEKQCLIYEGEIYEYEAMMDDVIKKKKECLGIMMKVTRLVADRVVNRTIAKHAENLLNSRYRSKTLKEADMIVDEEMAVLQEAIDDSGWGI